MNLYIDGQAVKSGAKLKDFRGDTLYFVAVVQEPSPGKSGKCRFALRKADIKDEFRCSVFYPSVVNGEIR